MILATFVSTLGYTELKLSRVDHPLHPPLLSDPVSIAAANVILHPFLSLAVVVHVRSCTHCEPRSLDSLCHSKHS